MLNRVVGKRPAVLIVGLFLIGSGLLVIAGGLMLSQSNSYTPKTTPFPTRMEERLVPTETAGAEVVVSPSSDPTGTDLAVLMPSSTAVAPTATDTQVPTEAVTQKVPTPTQTVKSTAGPTHTPGATDVVPKETTSLLSPGQRIGFVAPMGDVERYDVERLGAGWYLSCPNGENPLEPAGVECAYLVVVSGDGYRPTAEALQDMARRNPGRLWLVGNEPDVVWQGNSTPQEYAQAYHQIYHLLKEADPTCQVAIGGISQVTPLRLRYLEAVLAEYEAAHGQAMPVDVWNIHLAILREERGSWGVDIPPGLSDDKGTLYEIQDNADVETLKRQVVSFRHWMAERGLRDRPLIVTEFSVLMPPDYGFPFERVREFMLDAADYLMTAVDGQLGLPADGDRLVQQWAWYSLADETYYTGNLFNPDTGQITLLGKVFAEYAAGW